MAYLFRLSSNSTLICLTSPVAFILSWCFIFHLCIMIYHNENPIIAVPNTNTLGFISIHPNVCNNRLLLPVSVWNGSHIRHIQMCCHHQLKILYYVSYHSKEYLNQLLHFGQVCLPVKYCNACDPHNLWGHYDNATNHNVYIMRPQSMLVQDESEDQGWESKESKFLKLLSWDQTAWSLNL